MKNKPSEKPARLNAALQNSYAFEKKGQDLLAEVKEEVLDSESEPESEPRLEIGDRPSFSSVDPDESQEDLTEATGAFAASVDTITSGMLVILGQFDTSLKRAERLNRLFGVMSVLVGLVATASVWSVYRIEHILDSISQADRRIDGVGRKIDAREAEQPKLMLVPDASGGAHMVLQVPESLPVPPLRASGLPATPATLRTSVEIPISNPPPIQKR